VRLAQKLVRDGPCKIEHTARRVRGLLNGKYAFDTLNAHHVWELELRYPQYLLMNSSEGPHDTDHAQDTTYRYQASLPMLSYCVALLLRERMEAQTSGF
jgi:hypothetical protein